METGNSTSMFNLSWIKKIAVFSTLTLVGVASPALAAHITPVQAAQGAKNVLIRDAAKGGISFKQSEVQASCKEVSDEVNTFHCQASANSGQCKGTVTIYEEPGKGYRATDDKIGCGE